MISRRPAADPGLHPGCARRDLADGQRVLRAAAGGGADHAGRGLRAHSANVGLVVAMALLTIHGWLAGRAAPGSGMEASGRHLDCSGTGPADDLAQGPGPDPPALTPARIAQWLGGLSSADRQHGPQPLRLLPIRRTTPDRYVQLWNVGPAHRQRWTVLDDVPIPTDLRVAVRVAVQRRTASYPEDRSSTLVQPEPL
jgi:hypothetical protein